MTDYLRTVSFKDFAKDIRITLFQLVQVSAAIPINTNIDAKLY